MPDLLKRNKVEAPFFASKHITNKSFQNIETGMCFTFANAITIKSAEPISFINKTELQNVKGFRNLKENWDSYDAAPVNELSIEKAISFIKNVDGFDRDVYLTSPGPNGEVMVQLKNNNKEIEFIFYPEKDKYVLFDNNKFISQSYFKNDLLFELIEWLTTNE